MGILGILKSNRYMKILQEDYIEDQSAEDYEFLLNDTANKCINELISTDPEKSKEFKRIPLEDFEYSYDYKCENNCCFDYFNYIIDNIGKYYKENNIEYIIMVNSRKLPGTFRTYYTITVVYIDK